jgi:hypothetical protein
MLETLWRYQRNYLLAAVSSSDANRLQNAQACMCDMRVYSLSRQSQGSRAGKLAKLPVSDKNRNSWCITVELLLQQYITVSEHSLMITPCLTQSGKSVLRIKPCGQANQAFDRSHYLTFLVPMTSSCFLRSTIASAISESYIFMSRRRGAVRGARCCRKYYNR